MHGAVKTGIPPRSLSGIPSSTPLGDARVNIRGGDQVIVASKPQLPSGSSLQSSATPTPTDPICSTSHRGLFSPSGAAPHRKSKLSKPMETVQWLKDQARAAEQRKSTATHGHQPTGSGVGASFPARPTGYGDPSTPSTTPSLVATTNAGPIASSALPNRKHYRALGDEFVVLNIVPDDNSCLFTSVAIVVQGSDHPHCAQKMRHSAFFLSFLPSLRFLPSFSSYSIPKQKTKNKKKTNLRDDSIDGLD